MSKLRRKILVTGASGLVGTHLLPRLAAEHTVYAISRTGAQVAGAQTITLDLGQNWAQDDLPKDVDTIIHLAQSNLFRDFPENVDEVLSVNTVSTIRLLDFARRQGVKTFVLASSGGIYGNGATTFSEDAPIVAKGDLGFYIGTRLCAEILSEPYAAFMNISTLRFFFVYGPGQRDSMLIPRLIRSVQSGTPINLQGPEGLSINPVHVSDATIAICSALELDSSQKINIAGPNVLSLRAIAETIGQVVGKKPVFSQASATAGQDLVADIERMKTLLHHPEIGFVEGVTDLVRHMSPE